MPPERDSIPEAEIRPPDNADLRKCPVCGNPWGLHWTDGKEYPSHPATCHRHPYRPQLRPQAG